MHSLSDEAALLFSHLHAHATATQALTIWCKARFPQLGERVETRLLEGCEMSSATYRGPLRPGAGERLAYRRVELCWGKLVLSQAENWYFPDRLPGDAARRISETREPFGAAIAGFDPSRQLLSVTAPDAAQPGKVLMCVHALVHCANVEIAEVRETYFDVVSQPSGVS